MQLNKILFFLLFLTGFHASCKKLNRDKPAVSITADRTSIKAGEAISFSIEGYADYISFYAGVPDSNYDNINTYTAKDGNPELQFSSSVESGVASTVNLSLFVSFDFNGIYDTVNIRKANWVNITSRANLATSSTNTPSGIININDLKQEGKPAFVAFKYSSFSPLTLKQRKWTVSSFQFRTKFPNGSVFAHAPDNATAAFLPIEFAGDSAKWIAGTTLTHVGLNAGSPADEDWAITRAFDLSKINSDAGGVISVKNLALSSSIPKPFVYRYTKAGTFKAVFVYKNANREHSAQGIQSFTITVTP